MSIPPPPSRGLKVVETVLLLATDWNYTFSEDKQPKSDDFNPIPKLSKFMDALIDTLLDNSLENSMLWGHIACQIAYIYGHNSAVKDRSFSQYLKRENRQYHLDSLSGMRTGTAPFITHQRKIRDLILQDSFTLCECSASRDNEDLFPMEREKKTSTINAGQNEAHIILAYSLEVAGFKYMV
jgi:hypothetical protein